MWNDKKEYDPGKLKQQASLASAVNGSVCKSVQSIGIPTGGEHPYASWSYLRDVDSPRVGHAHPQYRSKRRPGEVLMEGRFPLPGSEKPEKTIFLIAVLGGA